MLGMLETLFFACLGITFVLIVMLVYHFKSRVLSLENKCDTMFEIINSMVNEIGQVRTVLNHDVPINNEYHEITLNNIDTNNNDRIHYDESSDSLVTDDDEEDVTDDDEEDVTDDDDDDDDEDVTDDDEDVIDDDDVSVDNYNGDEVSIDNDEVKVVNVEINGEIQTEGLHYELDETTSSQGDQIPQMVDVNIHVEKLENETNKDDSSIANSSIATFSSVPKKGSSAYKRMNLTALKSLIIEKGLASDPSKMKKRDLITLLETHDI